MRQLHRRRFCASLLAAGALGVVVASFGATDTDAPGARELSAAAADSQERGDYREAAAKARAAAQEFERAGNAGMQANALLQTAEALQALGEFGDAAAALNHTLAIGRRTNNEALQAAALAALGNVHVVLGPPARAEEYLNQASSLAAAASLSALRPVILINLGNHHAFQRRPARALENYEQAAALASASSNFALGARAYANAARVSLQTERAGDSRALIEQGLAAVARTPDSHDKAYLLINLARSLARLSEQQPAMRAALSHEAYSTLKEAEAVADRVRSPRALAYALGFQGGLYESGRRHSEALRLTQRAAFLALQAGDEHGQYLWHWQRGRLLKAEGQRTQAIAAFQKAVGILQTLRHQIPHSYDVPVPFREAAGQVYTELADLLLQEAAATGDPARVEAILRGARDTVEQFKAAELRDYFRDQCVDALQAKLRKVEQVSQTAAVLYPIVLDDRLELLLSTPSGAIRRYPVAVEKTAVDAQVRLFRELLQKPATNQYRGPARQLYDWLIRPLSAELDTLGVDTLVFVPDGALRTVPPAALFDGERFLIERYAVAVTPGVELSDPRPLDRAQLSALLAGLSKSVEGYPALHHVPEELDAVQATLRKSNVMLDESFQRDPLDAALRNPKLNVLHIATHAEFTADPRSSFLLAYDGRVTLDQLAGYVGLFTYRDTPLELLVLSGCETAEGDDRAALGLSGIAVKAGARSAIGSLWAVKDAATAQLVGQFYGHLQNASLSRAQALQKAQKDLLADLPYQHPAYWSPFLLISSWL